MSRVDEAVGKLFGLLSFSRQSCAGPADSEWPELLRFCDRTQMTLLLENIQASRVPEWVRRKVEARAARNAERGERLWAAYEEISRQFRAVAIDFAVLKGFTRLPFGEWRQRVQYDLDVLIEPDSAGRAIEALAQLGYAPHREQSLSDQHLPPMVRPFSWKWSGDYFDPNMPVSIDLHTQAWNDSGDRIRLEGAQRFWSRRGEVWFRRTLVPALNRCDRLAFAAMHAVRHILRNDARPAHVYEIAAFLHGSVRNEAFWDEWAGLHDEALRSIQGVAFRFAAKWFRCELAPRAAEAVARLPRPVRAWFAEFAWSPVAGITRPNKDAVWLHMALLGSMRDRASVLRRRLLPSPLSPRAPGKVANRAGYHASTIAPALASGFRWWRRSTVS